MPVQWGLAQPQGGGFDALESLQAIGQQQAQRQQTEIRGYGFQQQQRQDAARTGYANQARAGDFAGARQGAALGGDFDFANALGGLRDDHLKQLAREFDTIGVLHPQLKGIPVEQRAQIALPILRQAGFSDQELAGVDWSDAGLDGAFAMSQSGKAALAARLKAAEPYTLAPGSRRMAGGQMIADNPKPNNPDYIFDSESGSWLMKPGSGTGPASMAQPGYATPGIGSGSRSDGSGAPTAGRTQFGWTPRARNGGDNDDAAVDGKISGMSRALGISPTQDFGNMTNLQIAQALTLSEGGSGSLADRNNNPGNLTDPRTGGYRKFATKEAGLQAAAMQVARNRRRGQNTIQSMVEGLPVGGRQQPQAGGGGNAAVINVRPPKSADRPSRMTPQEVAAEGLDARTVYYRGKDGVPQAVSGQDKKQAANLTEGQSKAVGFLGRMVAAQDTLNTITGYVPNAVAIALNDLSNKNPIKGNISQTDRRVLNAQLAFANAVLRQESGAAIGVDEAAKMVQTLFPMPGDGPEVQADKRQQREAALAAMRVAAGPGASTVARVKANPNDRKAPGYRAPSQPSISPERLRQFKVIR